MSSRALKKLYGKSDLDLLTARLNEEDNDDVEEEEEKEIIVTQGESREFAIYGLSPFLDSLGHRFVREKKKPREYTTSVKLPLAGRKAQSKLTGRTDRHEAIMKGA